MEARKLTTTSYAVLGLLAIKSWTTYELTQQMNSGTHFWPRSRSKLFEEPKKLAAHGLAEASSDRVGNRPRTIYTITEEGRRVLADWLATPSQPPTLESEQLLKVFFADRGTKENLLATIAAIGEWAENEVARNTAVGRTYLAGLGPFPERAAVLALTGRFLTDYADMTLRWATWATATVQSWPDDMTTATPDWATFERAARHPDPPEDT